MRLMKQRRLRVEQLEDRCLPSANVVLEWNQLTLDAIRQTGMNTPLASRALAITQAAVYDSVNAIDRSFEPYHAHVHASRGASLEAAAAQAAHDTLVGPVPQPRRAPSTRPSPPTWWASLPAGRVRASRWGTTSPSKSSTWRSTDGSGATVPYTPGTDPGDWQPTPPAFLPALAPQWPDVTPFAMSGGSQFRPADPPALDSAEYAAAFNEVKDLGRADSTTRTADQTQIAFFWRDGAGTSYAFGHWNTIAQGVSAERGLDLVGRRPPVRPAEHRHGRRPHLHLGRQVRRTTSGGRSPPSGPPTPTATPTPSPTPAGRRCSRPRTSPPTPRRTAR